MNTSILGQVTDVGLSFAGPLIKRKTTDHIQIHHTVGSYGSPERWISLNKRNIEKDGHLGVGYSYLVTQSGNLYLGRGHEFAHGGVKDSLTNYANQRSIAIALDGDMREPGLPSNVQMDSALKLTQELLTMYSLTPAVVLGHNEVPLYSNGKHTGKTYQTLCPCIDMAAFRASLHSLALPTEVVSSRENTENANPAYPATYVYTGNTYSNIRLSPDASSPIVGRIFSNETCTVYGSVACTQYTWLQLDTGLIKGWCIASYLTEVQE